MLGFFVGIAIDLIKESKTIPAFLLQLVLATLVTLAFTVVQAILFPATLTAELLVALQIAIAEVGIGLVTVKLLRFLSLLLEKIK